MKQKNYGGLLSLLTGAALAVSLLLVLLTGGNAYASLAQRGAEAYETRIIPQYVAAKVRQSDTRNGVQVGSFAGETARTGDTLRLLTTVDATPYVTRVYWYDGWVRELFTAADGDFSPADGTPVMRAQALTFALDDGVLTVRARSQSGEESRLVLSLRSGGET